MDWPDLLSESFFWLLRLVGVSVEDDDERVQAIAIFLACMVVCLGAGFLLSGVASAIMFIIAGVTAAVCVLVYFHVIT